MPEITNDVQTVMIDYLCDKCKEGVMRRYGDMIFTTNPPQVPHKCNKCGLERNFTDIYPKLGYRKLKKEENR